MPIWREPLVHFLLLGAAIFALSQAAGPGGADAAGAKDKRIIVTAEKVRLLKGGFVLDNGREPTPAQLQRLIDNFVREEVLVREARAQGLDSDDSIIRRRLVEKMEFAVTEPPMPADAELEKYLAANPEAFRAAGGRLPPLAEIRDAVLAAWMEQRRAAEVDDMYQKYRAEYRVTVEAGNAAGGGT